MEESKNLKEEVRRLTEAIANPKGKNPKKFRIPFTSRISKTNLKKGYATIQVIHENGSVEFIKEPIIDSTVKLHGDTYHAVASSDVLNYKGKPFLIIPKKSKNPYNPNRESNETYGQKHIMSRMMNETIKIGKKVGLGIGIGVIIIVGIIIYALLTS